MTQASQGWPKSWQKARWSTYTLLIFALIFQGAAWLRRIWLSKIKSPYVFEVPIVIVGNVSVGGTGKTPVVAALVDFLKTQGWSPGIVMRGYKSALTAREVRIVRPEASAEKMGDEAVLLARKTACPVAIGINRPKAVALLLQTHPHIDMVISDDGLQHYALGRDIEIVVIDQERGLGNGFCLPAGPLRESAKRLKTVDFCLINGGEAQLNMLRNTFGLMPRLDPTVSSLVEANLKQDLRFFEGKTVHAVAGIGNPQRFFTMLKTHGMNIIPHAFPDHYFFRSDDFDFEDDLPILMTQKDAVKCQGMNLPQAWQVGLQVNLPEVFLNKFLSRLVEISKDKQR